MPEKEHAFLSASSAHRWLVCTASPTMCSELPDEQSSFAEEGATAHDLAEAILENNPDLAWETRMSPYYNLDMEKYVRQYTDYANGLIKSCVKPITMVEKKVGFSAFVPGGFGTVDFAVYDSKDNELHIVDFKYGLGVKVDSKENPQMKLYALGICTYLYQKGFDNIVNAKITLTIFQPRIKNVSSWETSSTHLIDWGLSIQSTAKEAYFGVGTKAIPGEHCRFCRAVPICASCAKFELSRISDISGKPLDKLTDRQLEFVLDTIGSYVTYSKKLKDELIERIKHGGDTLGYTLQEKKGKRVLTQAGREALKSQGIKVTKITDCSLTEIEKQYGKDVVTDDMIEYGKPSYHLVKKLDVAKEVFGIVG